MISKTKSDSSFPEGQFLISVHTALYKIDRNCHGGGIALFLRENILSKLLSTENAPIIDFYMSKLNL